MLVSETSTLNELCSVCKKCSIFPHIDNCTVQCIRDFNGVIDGVDLLEGFTVDERRDLLNMATVA